MKKPPFFLCIVCLLFSYTLNAQTYLSEGFENSFPPSGWGRYKVGGGQVRHWQQTSSSSHSGQYSAYHEYKLVYQDAWLVSPVIDLSGSANPALSYWDAVAYAGDAVAHNVLVSTNYVAGQNPWNYAWDTLCVQIGSNYWQYAGNIPLGDYKTSGVHIAWQYQGANAAEWYIDDISVHETELQPVNDSCQHAIIVNASYPENIADSNTWATFDCSDNLEFWNGVWYELALPYSCNAVELNLTALESDLNSAGIILSTDCSCQSSAYLYADTSSFTSNTSVFIGFYGVAGPGTVYLPVNIEPLQQFSINVDVTHWCVPPSGLDVSTFGESLVEVTWVEEGCATEWQVEYGPYGFVPTGIPTLTSVTSLPCQITGLEPGQCYQYRVRSVCGMGFYSDWSETMAFCTNCPVTVDSFQYLWNYEPPIFPPQCWTLSSVSDSTWVYGYTLQPPITHLTFCSWHPTQAQNEWLVTPSMDLSPILSPALSFNWMTSYQWMVDSNFADFRVLISLDGGISWGDTLFSEDAVGIFANWKWYSCQVDLAEYSTQSNVAFAFVYTGTNGDAFAFDNFLVGPMNSATSWTGEVNTDWFNTGNWNNFVPMESTTATIPNVSTTTGRNPVTNNVVRCYDLQVDSGGLLTIGEGTRLHALGGVEGPLDAISSLQRDSRHTGKGRSNLGESKSLSINAMVMKQSTVGRSVQDKKAKHVQPGHFLPETDNKAAIE